MSQDNFERFLALLISVITLMFIIALVRYLVAIINAL